MAKLKARLPGPRSPFGRFPGYLRRGAVAYGVLLISLFLTGLAWDYVRRTVETQNEARFEQAVRATRAAIERRAAAYIDAMFGARGLFLASKAVERAEWESYVNGVEPGDRLQGLQSLGFAVKIEPTEREAFARETREQGLPPLRPDLKPGEERRVYFPLRFMAPVDEANRRVISTDAYAYPAHRTTMDRARDSGSPQATGMVYVLTEAAPGSSADLALQPGLVVYLPVYREGAPQESVAERRRALQGFVVAAFRRDGLLDGIFGTNFDPAIDFEVYEGEASATSPLLYDNDAVRRAGEAGYSPMFSEKGSIEVAGRVWSLYFATLPGFEKRAESNLPDFVLASGIAVSILLFGITWMLARSRIQAERTSKALEDANRELEGANRELEAFSYSVSHDLRAPLRSIEGFSRILLEDYMDRLDDEGKDYLGRVRAASEHMGHLIDDLLNLSRVSREPLRRELVDLSSVVEDIFREFAKSEPERKVELVAQEGVTAYGDANLLRVALANLLGNAWKFTRKKEKATIEFGAQRRGEELAYYVRDNGVGFDMAYSEKLFGAFQRLHNPEEFEGTGIGLATVARIVHRHGGRAWANAKLGEGATFFFTLGGGHRQSVAPKETGAV